jgi:hypothetical protein
MLIKPFVQLQISIAGKQHRNDRLKKPVVKSLRSIVSILVVIAKSPKSNVDAIRVIVKSSRSIAEREKSIVKHSDLIVVSYFVIAT